MGYYCIGAISERDKLAANFLTIRALLISQGMPYDTATWGAAQVLYETNGLKSRVSNDDNNLSGIMWINKSYQNATKGRARPASESGYYAHFNEYRDWAKDFVRILSFGSRPISSRSLADYVNRLADNNYFTDSKTKYYNGVKMWLDRVRGAIPANARMRVTEESKAIEQVPYNIPNPDDRVRFFDLDLDARDKKTLVWMGLGLVALLVVTR